MNTILKLGPNSVVSQPGDPLVSPDGSTTVQANNDGTATIAKTTGLSATHEPSGATVQFENTAAELAAGITGGIRFKFTINSTTYDCTAPFWYSSNGFSDYGPISGGPSNWSDEKVEISTSGVDAFYGDAVFAPWTTISAGGSSTAIIATRPPYDAEIEYLESTGTQFIDTGVATSLGIRIAGRLSFDYAGGISAVCGSRTSGTEDAFVFWLVGNGYSGSTKGSLRFDYGTGAGTSVQKYKAVSFNAFSYPVSFSVEGSDAGKKLTFGEETLNAELTTSVQTNLNVFLFGANTNGTATLSGGIRLYRCAIYSGSTLVRDFIPVRVGTTGYLYDRVSGTLFGNAGTGDFVLGNDIDVHNALVTANTNFDNIAEWFANAYYEFTPTVTFNSGWSASTAIKIKVIGGRIGCITGAIKCSSALSAGTTYNPISAFTYPTGISLVNGTIISSAARAFIYFNNSGTHVIPDVAMNANTTIYFRGMIPLNFPKSWLGINTIV